jgi:signal transduction histidine kinase
MSSPPRPRSVLYGQLATAGAVLAQVIPYAFSREFHGDVDTAEVFGFGACYATLGILAYTLFFRDGGLRVWIYFVLQGAFIAAMARPLGNIVLLTLPLVCQAMEGLARRAATVQIAGLFVASIAVRWHEAGRAAGLEALAAYGATYAFTIAIMIVTSQAVAARDRAEQLRSELEVANTQLRARAAEASEVATMRERNRLAREIHDSLGHALTVMNVHLEAARAVHASTPEKSLESLDVALRFSRDALADVRHSVGTLRVDAPPLIERLRTLVTDAGMPVAMRVDGVARPLGADAEHALFRGAQEGLTNVRKHAAATHVDVTLDYRDMKRVALIVADNGRGHVAAGVDFKTNGFGLAGLRERVMSLGGSVTAANDPRGGFRLSIEVPA